MSSEAKSFDVVLADALRSALPKKSPGVAALFDAVRDALFVELSKPSGDAEDTIRILVVEDGALVWSACHRSGDEDAKPEPLTMEALLNHALHSFDGAAARWEEFRRSEFASDDEALGRVIAREFGIQGGFRIEGGRAEFKGGDAPEITFNGSGPKLKGRSLILKVREVIGIAKRFVPAASEPDLFAAAEKNSTTEARRAEVPTVGNDGAGGFQALDKSEIGNRHSAIPAAGASA